MRARLIITLVLALLLASCGDDDGVFTGTTMGATTMGASTTGGPTTTGASTTTTGSTISTTSTTAPAGLAWALVPDDEAVFGPPGGGTQASMRSVVAGGPGLVAVGYVGDEEEWDGAVWTSADGVNWSRVPDDAAVFGGPYDQDIAGVVAGGPGLVAVGSEYGGEDWDGAVWTSADGVNWSRVPHDEVVFGGPDIQDMTGVVAGGPGLVAVGWDRSNGAADAAVWVSADGLTWSRVPDADGALGGPGDQAMRAVAAGGPGLVAVGDDFAAETPGLAAAVWTSPDGLTWARVPHDEAVFGGPGQLTMWAVAPWAQGLVAAGYEQLEEESGSNTNAVVWTSPDGVTWARIPHDEAVFGGPGDQWIEGAAAAGPGLVLVGSDYADEHQTAVVWLSSDGAIWTRLPDDEAVFGGPGWGEMRSVAAGGPGLVAVGMVGFDDLTHAAVWVSPPAG